MQQATLCFLTKKEQLLLALKKRGFGAGKWNGVGGKVRAGESVEQAALREMTEEINVSCSINDLENVGFLDFYFPHQPDWNQRVHIFFIKNWQGQPQESEEMKPKWHQKTNLPFEQMWRDDKHWLPLILRGNKIKGEFSFNRGNNDFYRYKITLT